MTSPPDPIAKVLTGRAPVAVQVVAYVLCLMKLVHAATHPRGGLDNSLVVDAVRNVLDGVSPYVSDRFLYPPSAVPVALLQVPFSNATLVKVMPFVMAAALLIGWWASLRMFDVQLRSWLGTAGVAITPLFTPFNSSVDLGSWSAFVACLSGVALLLMGRGRWLAAGLVIGLSIAIKPMLMPIGLIFLLNRRWGGFAAASLTPVALCAVVLPMLPQPGLFFTKTIPFLLAGQDSFARPYDASLSAILPRLGADDWMVTAARATVFVVAVATAVVRWRRRDDERVRIVETSAILMTGTFLVMTPAFPHYVTIVVPALVASVVVPGSVARTYWFWLTVIPVVRLLIYPYIDYLNDDQGLERQVFKMFVWSVALMTLLVTTTWWRRRTPHGIPAAGSAGSEPAAFRFRSERADHAAGRPVAPRPVAHPQQDSNLRPRHS